MSALTPQIEIVDTVALPSNNFQDQINEWQSEIKFLEREKDFFLFLVKQSAEYSHVNEEVKYKLMADNIEGFTKARLTPFIEQLSSHDTALKDTKPSSRKLEQITKTHRTLQRQFQAIKTSFRNFKETTFDNVEDLFELKIV